MAERYPRMEAPRGVESSVEEGVPTGTGFQAPVR